VVRFVFLALYFVVQFVFLIMPKGLPSAKLSQLVPSEHELQEARQHLKGLSRAQMNSKKTSMRMFLSKNDDKDAASASSSSDIIERFHVHVMRTKLTEKKWCSDKTLIKERRLIKTLSWYGEEQLVSKFGKMLTAHWLESGLLPDRPNRITGSTLRFFIEFAVPDDYETLTEGEFQALRQQVKMELAEEDIETWEEMVKARSIQGILIGGGGPSIFQAPAETSSTGAILANPTEKTPTQIMAGKIEKLKANANSEVARLNQMVLDLKVMKTKADASEDADMMSTFSKALQGCVTRAQRLVQLVSKLITEPAVDEKMPQLVQLVESVDEKFVYFSNWARKFGCHADPVAAKQKRKRASGSSHE
jgi:hypothetical protein